LPQVGGLLSPGAEAPLGAREQALGSTPGAFCRCPDPGGLGLGEDNQLEAQLMSPAVLIPSAEMLVQVSLGPRRSSLILLLRLTQMDDYFFFFLFQLVFESETKHLSAELQPPFSSKAFASFTGCSSCCLPAQTGADCRGRPVRGGQSSLPPTRAAPPSIAALLRFPGMLWSLSFSDGALVCMA